MRGNHRGHRGHRENTEKTLRRRPNHCQRHTTELQGPDKRIAEPEAVRGLYVVKAWQSISFQLDKSGASIDSGAGILVGAIPRHFIVDRRSWSS